MNREHTFADRRSSACPVAPDMTANESASEIANASTNASAHEIDYESASESVIEPVLAPEAPRRRRGLTLMEVMFAIGVVMIGMLGIAILVPIAGKAAKDGASYDRAARLGLNAVREFHLREMGRPENWINPDYTAVGTPTTRTLAFCIDPRFVAVNNQVNMAAGDPRRFFPYNIAANMPAMRRVSLRRWSPRLSNSTLMDLAAANEIFMAGDDLLIDAPVDPLLPAQQIYFSQNPASPDKRQSDGEFSWMATLCPRADTWAAPNGAAPDTYTLSIVVFQGRDSALALDGISERWAIIPFTPQYNAFFGGGLGGGDVALVDKSLYYQLAGGSAPPPAPQELFVKRGQWILLARNILVGGNTLPVFRWYKVTEVDPDELGIATSAELLGSPPSGVPIRHVTLFGQDWIVGPSANPQEQTFAYIVPGVVAVYEKTIRLENSSLWTQ